ncbi:ribosome maturation factor RimM [Chloroflexota bacterium]
MKSHHLEFITVGKILAPWGTEGKLNITLETDFPQRFNPLSKIYVNRQPMTIDSTEWYHGKLIIKLDAINSIEEAQKLHGQSLEIHPSQIYSLPEGEYYHFQIIGLEVRTTQGELLGNITEVLSGKGNDNYIVHGDKGDILIPAIEDVVKSIDLAQGCVTIEAITGLLSLNQKKVPDSPAN